MGERTQATTEASANTVNGIHDQLAEMPQEEQAMIAVLASGLREFRRRYGTVGDLAIILVSYEIAEEPVPTEEKASHEG